MKLTKANAVNLHRELWRYLAATGATEKSAWPGWDEIEKKYGYIANGCFCCQYAGQEAEKNGEEVLFEDGYITEEICEFCPIDWTEGGTALCEMHGMGLFAEWRLASASDENTRKRLAMRIAKLPVR